MKTIEELRQIRWFTDFAYILKLNKDLKIRTFCECGVGPLDIAAAPDIYREKLADKVLLVEPNPELSDLAQAAMPEADIWRVAITDTQSVEGMVNFRINGGSSYVEGHWSPTPCYGPTTTVKTLPFRVIDDGTIDAMVLDCEGMEWAVLKDMKSRPYFLSVEVWKGHPHENEIFNWLMENKYEVRFTTGPEGETFFLERYVEKPVKTRKNRSSD
jgi:hypothetical protein